MHICSIGCASSITIRDATVFKLILCHGIIYNYHKISPVTITLSTNSFKKIKKRMVLCDQVMYGGKLRYTGQLE